MSYTTSPQKIDPDASTDRHIFRLDNGLQVAVQEDHFSPVVAIQFWVKAGSADETPDVAGAAHVHEHMLFKGTTKRPVGAIAAEIESSGGSINAFTTADHTVYHIVLASRHFSEGLDILGDAIQNSTFDTAELDKELQVVMEEWKRGEDSPTTKAATELFELTYKTHPYGRPVIGYRETVENLNRTRVVDFYNRWYHPNNMTLVVVGDVHESDVRKKIHQLFDTTERTSLPIRPRPPEPLQKEARLSIVDMDVEEFYLYLGFPLPPASHEDIFALDLLSFIAGGGESSPMVQQLQAEQELVNWVTSSAYTPADSGIFIVAAAVEREKHLEALKQILRLLFRYKHEPVSPEELDRARANLSSDFIYRRETVQGQARQLGYFLTVFSDADYEEQYLAGLSDVTPKDIMSVAKKYFSASNLNLVMLGKTEGLSELDVSGLYDLCTGAEDRRRLALTNSSANKADSNGLTVTQLENGVKILVKEHHNVPVFALQAATLGGLLFEHAENAGINNFIAGMLTRGSSKFSRQQFAETVESLAGGIAGFSGRNSIGLSGSFLAADVSQGLELFVDTLLYPTFVEDEVEKRCRETLLSLKNRDDDLAQVAFDLFYKTLYGAHPYGLLLMGTPESVATFDRARIREYYKRLLDPARLIVGVVGDIDAAEFLAIVEEPLSKLRPVQNLMVPTIEPRQNPRQNASRKADKQQAHVVLGFQGVTLDNPDRYALKVLDTILSRQGGRLFYEIREQRALAYSVTAFHIEGLAPGVFGVYLGTDPASVDEAIEATQAELTRIRTKNVSAEELSQAKKFMTGTYEISLQSNTAQSEEMVFNELYGLGSNYGKAYLEKLNEVTENDIRNVANTYLDPDTQTLVVVG